LPATGAQVSDVRQSPAVEQVVRHTLLAQACPSEQNCVQGSPGLVVTCVTAATARSARKASLSAQPRHVSPVVTRMFFT